MFPVSLPQRIMLVVLLLTCGLIVNAQDHPMKDGSTTTSGFTTTSPFNPPRANDYTFVINSGAGLDTGCTFRSGGPLRITLPIGRVLGNLAMLKANGLVPATVRVEFPAFDVDSAGGPPPERDRVSVNGNVVPGEFMTGLDGVWVMQRFNIPIEWLNLPTEPAAGGTVTPANNEIRIDIDTASGTAENWCTAVDWVTISIVNPIPPRPWIGAHGIFSDSSIWTGLWVPSIRALGIPADPGPNMGRLDSIQSNANKIGNAVTAARARWGVDRVNIVAHSKGGLDSREYIERNDTVENLVQLGTPNAGSPLADAVQAGSIALLGLDGNIIANLLAGGVGGYQLTTPYMAEYNSFHTANPNVTYMAIGGLHTPGGLFSDPLGRILQGVVGPGDLIVPLTSVHALPYTLNRTVFSAHPPTFGPASHTGIHQNTTAFALARPLVRAPGLNTASFGGSFVASFLEQPPLEPTNEAAVTTGLQHTKTVGGKLQPLQTVNHVIPVDAAGTLAFMLLHTEGVLDLKLTDPNGQVFDATTVVGNPNVSRQEIEIPGGLAEAFAFTGAFARGNWTASVTARNTNGPVDYSVAAWLEDAPLRTAAAVDTVAAPVGGNFVLSTTLMNGTAPVMGASVNAAVLLPDGVTVQNVALVDNGTGSDTVANDGTYTARFSGATQPGAYGVSLSETGSASGMSFSRESYLSFFASASNSTILSGLSESGRDLNGNGLFDELVLRVPVQITAAANYRMAATLVDSTGNMLEASRTFALTPTATNVELAFDGTTLFARGVNGPYKITSVRMAEEQNQLVVPVKKSSFSFSTMPYQFTQFEGAGVSLNGPNSAVGVDTDGNGKFNTLRTDIGINVRTAGEYQWTARLRDQSGREITLASNTGNLTVGLNSLRLSFDGAAIGRNGVNGPYAITDFLLNGPDTFSAADVFLSPPIAASAFEGFVAAALTVQFGAANYSVSETQHSVELTVTRTGATNPFSVSYRMADGTASERSDYTTSFGTLNFALGETSKTFRVLITDDAYVESNETFMVTLQNPTNGFVLGTPSMALVTITSDDAAGAPNPIDATMFFVREHYHDFLGREPDAPGLQFWIDGIETCGTNAQCREVKRINTSAAFYLSIEFQETGFFAIRAQRVAFGKKSSEAATRITYNQFIRDARQLSENVIVGQLGFEQLLAQNKQIYVEQVVASSDFLTRFPATQTAAQYVDALYASAGVTPTTTERQEAINVFGNGGAAGRAATLNAVADSASVRQAEFSPAFVLAQYFGYLRRDPDQPGYEFWLTKLNQFGGNFIRAEMVKAFISSIEYRQRFGQ